MVFGRKHFRSGASGQQMLYVNIMTLLFNYIDTVLHYVNVEA